LPTEVAVYLVVAFHWAVTLVPPLFVFAVIRWSRLVWVHLPILVWAFSIPFAQWPCPLTDLEKSLRAQAGLAVYDTHFVEQYFWKPLGVHGEAIFNWSNAIIIAGGYIWFVRSRFRRAAAHAAQQGAAADDPQRVPIGP
jgi:hypothetical protein